MADAEPSATARQKFACPACGAEAQWNPAKRALVCPFCGTEIQTDEDIEAALGGVEETFN